MRAINLTAAPVELDPVNGGMLPAPVDDSDDHVRELVEVTEHEEALERAGVILLDGEPTSDRYDPMDREALEAEVAERELTVTREDGREDLPPKESELRRALRVADTTGDVDQ
jgi:hypothetical protein